MVKHSRLLVVARALSVVTAALMMSPLVLAQDSTDRRVEEILNDHRYRDYRWRRYSYTGKSDGTRYRPETSPSSKRPQRAQQNSPAGESQPPRNTPPPPVRVQQPEAEAPDRTPVNRAQRSPVERLEPSEYEPPRSVPPQQGEARAEKKSSAKGDTPNLQPPPVGDGFGAVFAVISWIVIGLAVAAIIYGIVRAVLSYQRASRKKAEKERSKLKKAEVEKEDIDASDAPAPYADTERHDIAMQWQRALDAGDFALATKLRYKLFWARNGWPACLNEEDVHTWRDALRWIPVADLRKQTGRCLRLVESVRYGNYVPTQQEYEEWELGLPTTMSQLVGVGQ